MKILKKIFWKLPIPKSMKKKIHRKWFEKKLEKEEKISYKITKNKEISDKYIEQILSSYKNKSEFYKPFENKEKINTDIKLIAYYLTQFHPTKENDEWWGKGTTEWNNVNQAVPQYVGHYQPRKPGELGYYDLRLKENIQRQIKLATNYGIDCFCFYYYYFNGGARLLEKPLNIFLENKDLNIQFCYCWANENWTKRFSGTSNDILMAISDDVETYKSFIHSIVNDLKDNRYLRIKGKPVLSIYKPELIPNIEVVLPYWNKVCQEECNSRLYLIAVKGKNDSENWIKKGFDSITEFQYRPIEDYADNITSKVEKVNNNFAGKVYSYESILKCENYFNTLSNKNIYPAIMPMWDNTARRNNCGVIFDGSTPKLYREWLQKLMTIVKQNKNIDDKMIFINAWNEWGEGAYLEPDDYFGYAYLDATYEALLRSESDKND